ncbi:MAG: anaerobic magnesium-protoporphyrin IX monomethyl ester cyclase [Pseudohongiellaceae bacterium]|jgi:anaerobic magnesium-protoporphyrin IX monomethyl ester cyclase
MNNADSIITSSLQAASYLQQKSLWHGSVSRKKFRLALSFYSPDGNEISIPLASISAYLKQEFPDLEIFLQPILIAKDPEKYSPGNFVESLKALDVDLVAFSIMSPHWYAMENYLSLLKTELPDLPIVIGGYQAMLSQQQTIENPNVDFVCVGDGEHSMANIIRFLQGIMDGPVDGIWEKMSDGSIFETEPHQIGNLQELPFPDYDLFAKSNGFKDVVSSIFGPKGKIVLPVMTGRGCPYRCTYCCNTPLLENWRSKKTFLRKYDPEELADELVRLKEKYNVGYFEFWDELFLSNLKFVRAFFEIYKTKISLPFSINSRTEIMNEEFCKLAADAGCHTIWFGIESGDEKYRNQMLGRKMTNKHIVDAAENCKKAGIQRLTFNIVGMPLESAENMKETLRLNRQIAPEHFFFFPFIPLRGTPLYNTAKAEGLLLPLKKNLHYLSAANDREFFLNLKENPEILTEKQYSEICNEMLEFQKANNRLRYTIGNQGSHTREVTDTSTISTQSESTGSISINIDQKQDYTLNGAKLVLERAAPIHAEYIYSTFANANFWGKYRKNQNRDISMMQLVEKLERDEKSSPASLGTLEWVICRKSGDELIPIGLTALASYVGEQRRAEFLIGIVEPEDVDTGIGLEASLLVFDFSFNVINLNKLVSIVYSSNSDAQKSTLSLGFSQEGVFRKHFLERKSQHFIDLIQNGMLQEDFRSNRRLAALSTKLLGRNVTSNDSYRSIESIESIESIDADRLSEIEQFIRKQHNAIKV